MISQELEQRKSFNIVLRLQAHKHHLQHEKERFHRGKSPVFPHGNS